MYATKTPNAQARPSEANYNVLACALAAWLMGLLALSNTGAFSSAREEFHFLNSVRERLHNATPPKIKRGSALDDRTELTSIPDLNLKDATDAARAKGP